MLEYIIYFISVGIVIICMWHLFNIILFHSTGTVFVGKRLKKNEVNAKYKKCITWMWFSIIFLVTSTMVLVCWLQAKHLSQISDTSLTQFIFVTTGIMLLFFAILFSQLGSITDSKKRNNRGEWL